MWRPAALMLVAGCALARASSFPCADASECSATDVEGSILLQSQRHAAALQSVEVATKDSNQSNRPIVILDFDTNPELDNDKRRCWVQPDVAGFMCTLCVGDKLKVLKEDHYDHHYDVWEANCPGDVSKFVLQRDGNLVLHDTNNVPCWSSHTEGTGGQQLVFEVDGTLVLYDRSEPPIPLWQSPSWNCGADIETEVLDSVFNPITAFDGKCWRHSRIRYGQYCQLCLQLDGNMVIRYVYADSSDGDLVWASNTDSSGQGKTLHMQSDGNLVVYSPDQKPKSVSNTPGSSMAKLVFGNDGNLVLYDRARQQSFWSSGTTYCL